MKLTTLLTQTSYTEQVEALGYSREVLHRLAKRGAIVIDGVVYAPVTKRKRSSALVSSSKLKMHGSNCLMK